MTCLVIPYVQIFFKIIYLNYTGILDSEINILDPFLRNPLSYFRSEVPGYVAVTPNKIIPPGQVIMLPSPVLEWSDPQSLCLESGWG